MKAAISLFLLFAAGCAAAAPALPGGIELRQALRKYDAQLTLQPRQLTAGERAELRRQLAEQGRPQRPQK
jgi:hypothetical protein